MSSSFPFPTHSFRHSHAHLRPPYTRWRTDAIKLVPRDRPVAPGNQPLKKPSNRQFGVCGSPDVGVHPALVSYGTEPGSSSLSHVQRSSWTGRATRPRMRIADGERPGPHRGNRHRGLPVSLSSPLRPDTRLRFNEVLGRHLRTNRAGTGSLAARECSVPGKPHRPQRLRLRLVEGKQRRVVVKDPAAIRISVNFKTGESGNERLVRLLCPVRSFILPMGQHQHDLARAGDSLVRHSAHMRGAQPDRATALRSVGQNGMTA